MTCRIVSISVAMLAALAIAFSVSSADAEEVSRRPNVIVILTDDQGFGDLGCHGNPVLKTPNIDRLAAEGVNLTNFHVHPFCSPTRAAFMSGLYPHRAKVWSTINGRDMLRRDVPTMADVFKASGYATAIFGKWHIGGGYPYAPQYRGFDEVLTMGSGGPGTTGNHWQNTKWDDHYDHNSKRKQYSGYCNDVFFDQAMRYIRHRKAGKPFFVYLPTFVPHIPWNVPKEWVDPYRGKEGVNTRLAYFFATISRLDRNVGRLREFLEEEGLADNTLLLFFTDNGSSGGWAFYNAGHRGKKGSFEEHGHRVPCFVHWPAGGMNRHRKIDALTAHIDWLPTLIDLCRLETPDGFVPDGQSMAALLQGKETTNAPRWKDRIHVLDRTKVLAAPRKADWQVLLMKGPWRLWGNKLTNVKDDPLQQKNVIESHPELVRELRSFYDRHYDAVSTDDAVVERPELGVADEDFLNCSSILRWARGCWSQSHVLKGARQIGPWMVSFSKTGTYEFDFYRWPRETGVGLTNTLTLSPDPNIRLYDLPVYISSFGNETNQNPNGKPLPIAGVRLVVNDKVFVQKADGSKPKVTITAEIPAGDASLKAVFVNNQGRAITVPYYTYVRRVE